MKSPAKLVLINLGILLSLGVCAASSNSAPSDLATEPALTARLAEMTLLKLPPEIRAQITAVEPDLRERLQMMPVLPTTDPAAQLKHIFNQTRDNVASAELLAAASRAVVGLVFAQASESQTWRLFSEAVALRTQWGDVALLSTNPVEDPAAFASALAASSQKLQTEVSAAYGSGDGEMLTKLRKQSAGQAVQKLADVWAAMLAMQAHPAKTAALPAASGPASQKDSGDAPVPSPQVIDAPAPAPAHVIAPQPAARATYVGNKESKKFHKPGCRFGPGAANSVALSSRQQAVNLGYTPCRVCKP